MLTELQVAFVQGFFADLDAERAGERLGLSPLEARAVYSVPQVRATISALMEGLLAAVADCGRRVHDPLPIQNDEQNGASFRMKVILGRE